jgi:hypothetical protein
LLCILYLFHSCFLVSEFLRRIMFRFLWSVEGETLFPQEIWYMMQKFKKTLYFWIEMKKKKIWEMKIHYELLKHCQYSFYNLRLSPIDCTIYYEVMLLVGVFFFFFFFFLKKKNLLLLIFFLWLWDTPY